MSKENNRINSKKPDRNMLVALIGTIGSGKTYLA